MAARAPVGQLEGSWKTQLLHALGAVRPKNSIPRVWVDVGTSYKTLAKWDVNNNASLVVVGVDPVQSNIEHSDHPKTPRFVRVHGACAEGAPGFVTLNVHKSPTCASLHATRRDAPAAGLDGTHALAMCRPKCACRNSRFASCSSAFNTKYRARASSCSSSTSKAPSSPACGARATR